MMDLFHNSILLWICMKKQVKHKVKAAIARQSGYKKAGWQTNSQPLISTSGIAMKRIA